MLLVGLVLIVLLILIMFDFSFCVSFGGRYIWYCLVGLNGTVI